MQALTEERCSEEQRATIATKREEGWSVQQVHAWGHVTMARFGPGGGWGDGEGDEYAAVWKDGTFDTTFYAD